MTSACTHACTEQMTSCNTLPAPRRCPAPSSTNRAALRCMTRSACGLLAARVLVCTCQQRALQDCGYALSRRLAASLQFVPKPHSGALLLPLRLARLCAVRPGQSAETAPAESLPHCGDGMHAEQTACRNNLPACAPRRCPAPSSTTRAALRCMTRSGSLQLLLAVGSEAASQHRVTSMPACLLRSSSKLQLQLSSLPLTYSDGSHHALCADC